MTDFPDSADLELQFIRQLVDLTAAEVLEVGCGEGRTTIALAERVRRIVGLELDALDLEIAQRSCPPHLRQRLHWCQGRAEQLPFAGRRFDVVLFGWSL